MKTFKRIILVLSVFLVLSSFSDKTIPSSFCDGFEEGYSWKYNDLRNTSGFNPLIPLCPLPELNRQTYAHGYEKGVEQAKEDY